MFLAASLSGYRFTDYVSLGDEFQQNPPVKACGHAPKISGAGGACAACQVQMGCHSRETKLFVTQKARGFSDALHLHFFFEIVAKWRRACKPEARHVCEHPVLRVIVQDAEMLFCSAMCRMALPHQSSTGAGQWNLGPGPIQRQDDDDADEYLQGTHPFRLGGFEVEQVSF